MKIPTPNCSSATGITFWHSKRAAIFLASAASDQAPAAIPSLMAAKADSDYGDPFILQYVAGHDSMKNNCSLRPPQADRCGNGS